MNLKHATVVGLGVLVLLIGLSMPATTTQTSTTCVDSTYDIGDGCVDTNYQAPNPSRGPTIGFGLLLVLIGGALSLRSSSTGTNKGVASPPNSGRSSGGASQDIESQQRSRSMNDTQYQGDTPANQPSTQQAPVQNTASNQRPHRTLAERVTNTSTAPIEHFDRDSNQCNQCGQVNRPQASYCSGCGSELHSSEIMG